MKNDSVAHYLAEEEDTVCCSVPIVSVWEEADANLTPDHQAAAEPRANPPPRSNHPPTPSFHRPQATGTIKCVGGEDKLRANKPLTSHVML